MKKSLGNVVVKDIKNTSLLRPRLLKSLKLTMENYLRIGKTYFNVITTFSIYTPIIKTKGIRFYTEGLTARL